MYANARESITVTVQEVTPRSVGALVALYERAVGIYASLVNINACHQPGKYLFPFAVHLGLEPQVNNIFPVESCLLASNLFRTITSAYAKILII